jgi:DNA-binding NarL/FixJ family response regulator
VISVALIEDNRLVREGISALLNQVTDLRIVAAGSSGDTSLLRDVNPQVVLLDVGLGNGDSLRMAEKVKKEIPECKIIVMDLLPVPEEVMEFVDGGVSGFIMKDATPEELVNTIRTVAEGAQVLPPADVGAGDARGAQSNLAVVGGKLDRIGEQVVHDLLDLACIHLDHTQPLGTIRLQADPAGGGFLPDDG